MPATKKRQEYVAGPLDCMQLQCVDVYAHFPENPPSLRDVACQVRALSHQASLVRMVMGTEVANMVPWSTLVGLVHQVSDAWTQLGMVKAESK